MTPVYMIQIDIDKQGGSIYLCRMKAKSQDSPRQTLGGFNDY